MTVPGGLSAALDADGSALLTSAEVQPLLAAAVEHAGGRLGSWRLQHVDAHPGRSTTATYAAAVEWPTGPREELLGASARVGGRRGNDDRATVFGDGDREVAVWLYPDDPDLPGLRRAATAGEVAAMLAEHQVLDRAPTPEQVALEMISYRPRRRAVVKVTVDTRTGPQVYFIKVLREPSVAPILERHRLLTAAGFPAPVVAAITADFCLVTPQLPGRPLALALFDESMPCTAEALVAVLDAIPPAVVGLPRRPPWTDAVGSYAEMVACGAAGRRRPAELAGHPGHQRPRRRSRPATSRRTATSTRASCSWPADGSPECSTSTPSGRAAGSTTWPACSPTCRRCSGCRPSRRSG